MQDFSLSLLKLGRSSFLTREGHLLEQVFVVAFLDPQDVMEAVLHQLTDMRSIRTQGILSDRKGQMRIVLLQLNQKSLGCIALTVVLGLAVLLYDRFWHQRDDFPTVWVNDNGAHQLMMVGHLTCPLVDLLQTGGAVDRLRAKVSRAIQ